MASRCGARAAATPSGSFPSQRPRQATPSPPSDPRGPRIWRRRRRGASRPPSSWHGRRIPATTSTSTTPARGPVVARARLELSPGSGRPSQREARWRWPSKRSSRSVQRCRRRSARIRTRSGPSSPRWRRRGTSWASTPSRSRRLPEPPPFEASADLASLAGFTPAWGVAAPVRALDADGTMSHHPSRLDEEPSLPSPSVRLPRCPRSPLPPWARWERCSTTCRHWTISAPPAGQLLELDTHPEQSGWSGASSPGLRRCPVRAGARDGLGELDAAPKPPATVAVFFPRPIPGA